MPTNQKSNTSFNPPVIRQSADQTRAGIAAHMASFDAAELIAYLDIVQQVVIELLSERGMTEIELTARRKEIVNSELAAIDAEIAKFSPPTL